MSIQNCNGMAKGIFRSNLNMTDYTGQQTIIPFFSFDTHLFDFILIPWLVDQCIKYWYLHLILG